MFHLYLRGLTQGNAGVTADYTTQGTPAHPGAGPPPGPWPHLPCLLPVGLPSSFPTSRPALPSSPSLLVPAREEAFVQKGEDLRAPEEAVLWAVPERVGCCGGGSSCREPVPGKGGLRTGPARGPLKDQERLQRLALKPSSEQVSARPQWKHGVKGEH